MRCEHCDTRIEDNKPFKYEGFDFCCECMSAFCSWFLDGGIAADPEQFGYVEASS